jgi:hypothetical protein
MADAMSPPSSGPSPIWAAGNIYTWALDAARPGSALFHGAIDQLPTVVLAPIGPRGSPSLEKWSLHEDRVEPQTVGRGQEFVLDTHYYPDALSWVGNLFSTVPDP